MFSPHCCGFYSFTGMIFMSFVYAMLSTQPFFVTGIDEPEEAQSNALGALITFGVFFGVCVFLIHKNKKTGLAYDTAADDYNRLNIDLKKNFGEQKVYGSVATGSY
jgi:hypothetical protein